MSSKVFKIVAVTSVIVAGLLVIFTVVVGPKISVPPFRKEK